MHWEAPPKPAEAAETRLISAILDDSFPIDSNLPAERELAAQLGVTRPTLREALQRLARDGWVEIQQGRPTRVRNYWVEGNLGVLGAVARHKENLPPDFVPNLLTIRCLLAPTYTRLALERDPRQVLATLQKLSQLEDSPEAFARADLELHCCLTIASGNPVFTLILNGFRDLYETVAVIYFTPLKSRDHSRRFYAGLTSAIQAGDAQAAEALTQKVMAESLTLWRETTKIGALK